MTLVYQVRFDFEYETSGFISVPLTVATNWTPEVPQILFPLLKLIQSWRQEVYVLNLCVHEVEISQVYFTTSQEVLQVALIVWQLMVQCTAF